MFTKLKFLYFISLLILLETTAHCGTLFLATPQKNNTGSMLVSYSIDRRTDPNIYYEKARLHKKDERRILSSMPFSSDIEENAHSALLSIPEISETHAYLRAEYGIINDAGLCIGVSEPQTSREVSKTPLAENLILNSRDLSYLLLERCENAQDALNMATKLIDTYGLYGESAAFVIADSKEAFYLEMLPGTEKEKGFYAAKRIDSGQFLVSADQFRLQDLYVGDTDFVLPADLRARFIRAGFDKGLDEEMNFQKDAGGIEKRPYYSLRRVWRALTLVDPASKLKPQVKNYDTKDYPLTVSVKEPLDVKRLFELHRDTYRGTQFDNSTRDTGGLFASPYTYEDFGERTINSTNSTYTFVIDLNAAHPKPVVWVALGSSGESTFIPLTLGELPQTLAKTSEHRYSKDKIFWLNRNISMLCHGHYSALSDYVRTKIMELEQRSLTLIKQSARLSPERFDRVIVKNVDTNYRRIANLYADTLEKYDGGYMLRYADGHEPKSAPIKYRRAKHSKEQVLSVKETPPVPKTQKQHTASFKENNRSNSFLQVTKTFERLINEFLPRSLTHNVHKHDKKNSTN